MLMYGEVVILLGKGGDIRHNSIGNKAEETVFISSKDKCVCIPAYICIYLCVYTDICN